MFQLVLYQPEIPPNTGNIIRLCANTGTRLGLVRPLGFELDDARLRRAGLDYHEFATVAVYDSLAAAIAGAGRVFAFSTRGRRGHHEVAWAPGDCLVFGPETRGLPRDWLDSLDPDRVLRIPMRQGSRSLNLANACAVAVYEAWRQQGFTSA